MEKLTKAEEPIMKVLWKLEKAFVKDVIRELPNPKPPYNTVSSIIRILEEKKMVDHNAYGKTYQYFPLVSKTAYSKTVFTTMVKEYFDGSYTQIMSFLINEKKLSQNDIAEIKKIINQKEYE